MNLKISRPSTLYGPSQLPTEVTAPEFLTPVAAPVPNVAVSIEELLAQCKQAVTELNTKLDAVAEVIRLRDEVFKLQARLNEATEAKPNTGNLEI